jgi:nicotinamidase/pyrazinamidase
MDKEVDSYSGFFDNDKLKSTGLGDYLKARNVSEVAVCGLALDYCVYFTANDSIDLGFKTSIIENASKAIDQAEYQIKKIDFLAKGGFII